MLPQLIREFPLQVDECGLPVPRTLARMAAERGVSLVFGPKQGQWRIEADEEAEERIASAATQRLGQGSLGHSASTSVQRQREASMHALHVVQSVRSLRSTGSENTQISLGETPAPRQDAPAVLNFDPSRLMLPRIGYKREELRDALADINPIDEASASDQVP